MSRGNYISAERMLTFRALIRLRQCFEHNQFDADRIAADLVSEFRALGEGAELAANGPATLRRLADEMPVLLRELADAIENRRETPPEAA